MVDAAHAGLVEQKARLVGDHCLEVRLSLALKLTEVVDNQRCSSVIADVTTPASRRPINGGRHRNLWSVRKDLIAAQHCSIARASAIIADSWSLLIVREALGGATRFADFQEGTGAQPSVISDRLKHLLEAGIFTRFEYSAHPPRQGYRLTEQGEALQPVLAALNRWGDTYLAGEKGPPVIYRHTVCGHDVDPTMVCGHCAEPLRMDELIAEPGPGAPSKG